MATLEDLRRLALALPEVDEVAWYDQPTFSVRKKGFAYSWRGKGLLRLGRARLEFLLEVRPEVFERFPLPGGNWATVDLAAIDEAELGELVRQAWAGVAPAKLRKSLENA